MFVLFSVINLLIAISFIAYSYKAAVKLKESGSMLLDGDTDSAGNSLLQAGTMYQNLIKAGIFLVILVTLVSIFTTRSYTSGNGFIFGGGELDACGCLEKSIEIMESDEMVKESAKFAEDHPECADAAKVDYKRIIEECPEVVEQAEEAMGF